MGQRITWGGVSHGAAYHMGRRITWGDVSQLSFKTVYGLRGGRGTGGSKAGPATRSPFGPLRTGWVKTHASSSASFFLCCSLSHTSHRRLAAESWRSKNKVRIRIWQLFKRYMSASFLIIHLLHGGSNERLCESTYTFRKALSGLHTAEDGWSFSCIPRPRPTGRCGGSGGAAMAPQEQGGWRQAASPC